MLVSLLNGRRPTSILIRCASRALASGHVARGVRHARTRIIVRILRVVLRCRKLVCRVLRILLTLVHHVVQSRGLWHIGPHGLAAVNLIPVWIGRSALRDCRPLPSYTACVLIPHHRLTKILVGAWAISYVPHCLVANDVFVHLLLFLWLIGSFVLTVELLCVPGGVLVAHIAILAVLALLMVTFLETLHLVLFLSTVCRPRHGEASSGYMCYGQGLEAIVLSLLQVPSVVTRHLFLLFDERLAFPLSHNVCCCQVSWSVVKLVGRLVGGLVGGLVVSLVGEHLETSGWLKVMICRVELAVSVWLPNLDFLVTQAVH